MKLTLSLFITSCLIFFSASESFAQRNEGELIKYAELSQDMKFKASYKAYEAKDGSVYKEGDTIKIGAPSGTNGRFVYITSGSGILSSVESVGPESANTNTVIKAIYIAGTKRAGFKVVFKTKGQTALSSNYYFNIEDCIASGEIKSKGMNSDEALAELKKAKDKLDLGLITKEEYEKKKAELVKYIQ